MTVGKRLEKIYLVQDVTVFGWIICVVFGSLFVMACMLMRVFWASLWGIIYFITICLFRMVAKFEFKELVCFMPCTWVSFVWEECF